jgi:hypothetical protein
MRDDSGAAAFHSLGREAGMVRRGIRRRPIESIAGVLVVVVGLAFHALQGCGGAGRNTGTAGAGGAGTAGTAGQGGAAGSSDGSTSDTSGAGTTGASGTTGVSGTTGAAGVTGTTGASGTTGFGGGSGSCVQRPRFEPRAPAVPENRVAQAFTTNAAAGGTIVEGIYWLTSVSLYTGPAGATGATGTTRTETLIFSRSNVADAVVQSSGSRTQTSLTFSTAVSGSSLVLTGTCPVSAPLEVSYTAKPEMWPSTPDALTLWVPSNGTNPPEVRVYMLPNTRCTSPNTSTAPAVPLNRVAEVFPATAAGGKVLSGVYSLTAATQYTGPGGATGPSGMQSKTLQLIPNTDQFQLAIATGPSKDVYGDWLLFDAKVAASALELTQVCPTGGAMSSLPYTATATTLEIYNASNSTVESYTMR